MPPGTRRREPRCWSSRTWCESFHQAGIEVILDVVFNHTAEGDETGPTLHFRGLDNAIYYLLDDSDRRLYQNFSGCGNTLNCNHPVVRSFIRNCLRYWVIEMHVDGFRFDLASILGRDRTDISWTTRRCSRASPRTRSCGTSKSSPRPGMPPGPTRWAAFPGTRWSEWNGTFRDDVRRFWRGEPRQPQCPGHADHRLERPLPHQRQAAPQLDQFHHLATTGSP